MASENPLPGTDSCGPRRRLHFAQLQPAKAVFESVQQFSRIETPLDVGLTQRHHLPRPFADFKGRFAGPLSSRIHPMSSSMTSYFVSSARSQARAIVHSRTTVAGEILITSAVSSIVKPPK